MKREALWDWGIRLVVWAALAGCVWRFVILPVRVDRLHTEASAQYQSGDFAGAISTLERAYRLDSHNPKVNLLLGQSHMRLGQAQSAEFHFGQAYRSIPESEEAQRGLAIAHLSLDKGDAALPLLQELDRKHPNNKQIQRLMAEAYVKSGRNLRAAEIYRAMLERDPDESAARREFLALYGYPEYRRELPLGFSSGPRPSETQVYFRTRGSYFQARVGEEWKDVYLVGVNLGPARPGEFPSTASREFSTYLEWLKQIGEMNANTVRVYTVLPPAFYQALKAYNGSAASPLWLVQEIWIHDQAEDLYDSETRKTFEQDLFDTIDLLHGQGGFRYRRGSNYGIYTADVSRYTLALAVGREIEPRTVQITNFKNPRETSFQGRYIRIENANPSEVWFARMCDLAVRYEVEKYNAQRPLTVVNWPPLDPLAHPTETPYAEEIRIRKSLGELISLETSPFMNDADMVSVDITKFRPAPEFQAGLFAMYHVYQHWPDFMLYEPGYALARDGQGRNRYLGYLRELKKAHANIPLLVGEYGLATSLGVAHLHPEGWNNGGFTEKQQAELLVRFTKNIRETGCAGALVFEWADEWFKRVHDLYTADYERPWDRDPLWWNALDPEEAFGLVGYEPALPVPQLRGEQNDWRYSQQLYAFGGDEPGAGSSRGELRAVYAHSDSAYFYLLLIIERGPLDWDTRNYWIALNTFPGRSGSRLLPEIGLRLESGANFLIQLTGLSSSRMLIAENYSPNQRTALPGRPGQIRILRRRGMKLDLADSSRFQEILTEANEPRYARDGGIFPALNFNRSPLPFGTADRANPRYSSHALWYAEPQKGMIELRIPWGSLLVMDPSDMRALGGIDAKGMPLPEPTAGISVAVIALSRAGSGAQHPKIVTSSLPAVGKGKFVDSPRIYAWPTWNQVQFRPYFKQSFFALQKLFAEMGKMPGVSSAGKPTRRYR